jgi:citrate lyase subunit beta / citryl-CoA lyase
VTDMVAGLPTARSLLFVPGSRPDRFVKAADSGADLVVIDLEDAVAPAGKAEARRHAVAWLAEHAWGVRINPPGTEWFAEDLDAIARHRCVVMVPKAESAEQLADICGRLAPGSAVVALVETAAGVLQAEAVAAVDGVDRLAFGNFDLAAQLGVSPDDRDAMATARGTLVLASTAAGIAPPFDGVSGDVRDDEGLRVDLAASVRLGFSGKLCIHPRQVDVVHHVLAPAEEEIAWADRIVRAAGDGGVAVVDGQMVDKPVVDRARRILERHARPS